MREELLTIATSSGPMQTFAIAPAGRGNERAVILYMDVFGLREELFSLAREFSELGYLAVVPDLFHRLPVSTFPLPRSENDPLPADAVEANRATTLAKTLADTSALIDCLGHGTQAFQAREFAVIGYCMGGRHALAAAAAFPQSVRAGLSVHGGKLVKDGEASPHLLIEKLQVPFHFAFAKEDHTCPEAHKAVLREAARNASARVTFSDHDACHGWTFPGRWSYDADTCDMILQQAATLFASAFRTRAEPA